MTTAMNQPTRTGWMHMDKYVELEDSEVCLHTEHVQQEQSTGPNNRKMQPT